ncbi:hypothetical protein NQZ79_g7296 [Umbelopsis isabellina]|nr:hypothetical protein NQZ79_g7296 [Umbelopsis isabellina]
MYLYPTRQPEMNPETYAAIVSPYHYNNPSFNTNPPRHSSRDNGYQDITGQQTLQDPSTVNSANNNAPSTNGSSGSYFTWLVFLQEKWVPFDFQNQGRLEQTLSLGGTFVDIEDSHFPSVKRVRVFPRSNYLSYLGIKYRLSRVLQPDAWMDHDEQAQSWEGRITAQPDGW